MTLAEAFYKLSKLISQLEQKTLKQIELLEDREYQRQIIQTSLESTHLPIRELAGKIAFTMEQLGEQALLSKKLIEPEVEKAVVTSTTLTKNTASKSSATVFIVAFLLIGLIAAGYGAFLLLRTDVATVAEVSSAPDSVISPLSDSSEAQQAEVVAPVFRLHGSNTVGESLAPNLLNAFLLSKQASSIQVHNTDVDVEKNVQAVLKQNGDEHNIAIEIHAHGSSTGFKDLLNGRADMAMSSRKIKEKELAQLKPQYGDLKAVSNEHVIGVDGLAVIVHPSNSIDALSSEQIAGLFSGRISDWSDIGGRAGRVSIYARDKNSGTWDSFKSMILKKNNVELSETAQRFESSSLLSEKVSNDVNAIGFIGLPYVKQAKALAVADTANSMAIYPTAFTVATEDYPLSRRLYLYTPETPKSPLIREFVGFVLSEAGQQIVKETGFISQNITAIKPSIVSSAPESFKRYVKDAQRLSLSLRFIAGRSELDNKGQRDIQRLMRYFQNHPEKNLMLFGFADSYGKKQTNLTLSEQRAKMVSELFIARGINPTVIAGFGEALPVAGNDTAFGRYKNRRVEAWVF